MAFISRHKGKLLYLGAMAILAGSTLGRKALLGDAHVYVILPIGRSSDAIELSANGQLLTPESGYHGRHIRFALERGDYTFHLKDKVSRTERTYALKLDTGFDEYVRPLYARQCFMRLDVSNWYNREKEGKRPAPLVDARIFSEAPFALEYARFGLEDLPKENRPGMIVTMLMAADCDALKKQNDFELLLSAPL
jgi:hypothetical protein